MPDTLNTTNSFKSTDPELLKKAVTEKVEKLINVQLKKQPIDQKVC